MRGALWVAGLLWVGSLCAAEPPAGPILRIDPGMHTAPIWRIAIDAQARWAVTASHDKTARVWNLATGRLEGVLRPPLGPGEEGKLYAAALSPDGSTVALGGWTQFNDGHSGHAADGEAIFVFDRASGRMLKCIQGQPEVIFGLAFSTDGRYLAATSAGNHGVRVYRSDTWALLGEDTNYADSSYGADFNRQGRLVTSSDDGWIRLYEVGRSGLKQLTQQTVPGVTRPYMVRFSPDGRSIAVGSSDDPIVNVLDADSLMVRFIAPQSGSGRGGLSGVAWSADGQALYAAGIYAVNRTRVIRQWLQAGQAAPRDAPAATDTIMDLHALPDGGLLFATANPSWGVLDRQGRRSRFVPAPTADLRDNAEGFKLSRDAGTVSFAYEDGGQSPALFDLQQGLSLGEPSGTPLVEPRTEAPGLTVTNWRNTPEPKLNGTKLALLPFEFSHSLAITPDGQQFVLGGDFELRLFDHSGAELWRTNLAGAAWAVNVSGDGRTVAAALSDGTIRWYDATDGHEKLAFFPHADRKRWVIWTPAGYYNASPGGEDLIGWHLNRGKDSVADFIPASRLRSKFNRPDVIAATLSAPSDSEALRLADAASGRKAETSVPTLEKLLPPVVEILSPQDGAAVSSNTITVRYATRAPADAPVTGTRSRVNGQAVPASRGLARIANGDEQQLTISIPSTDSEIQLFAENRNGVSAPATVHVSWAGEASPAAAEAPLKPKLYVLAVGVSKYANPAFNLDLAAKDAHDFADVVMRQKGLLYADVEVRLLTDAEATKDNVLDGLEWLQREITAHDVGMVFLAGHGMNDNTGKYYFMPHNADPDRLLRTGVPQADIRDTLGSLAGKVVFFVDTCHSGNVLGTAKTRGLESDINSFVNDLASAENGVVVFTASTGRQFSLEDAAWGNGAFTKALVEGLSGGADLQKSGRITLKELDYFVDERVKQLTGGRQSPVSIAPGGVPDFPIAVVRAP